MQKISHFPAAEKEREPTERRAVKTRRFALFSPPFLCYNKGMDYYVFMDEAIKEAKKAEAEGDVPVGAVAVLNGEIIGRGHNQKERDQDPAGHAEIAALREAAAYLQNWRLQDVTLFVTMEPCPMCAGAIINARIPRVVYGASDRKAGCCGSILNLFDAPFNHHPEVVGGVLAEESAALLAAFFASLRERRLPRRHRRDFMPPDKQKNG